MFIDGISFGFGSCLGVFIFLVAFSILVDVFRDL
jgi:hypothetical protein